jgi:hypothetical protein
MKAPLPSRCLCGRIPASAEVICTNCGNDTRVPVPVQCPYFPRECDCGRRAFCIGGFQ